MRTVAYCGDHTALTTTNWGDKIYVDTRDVSIAPHIMIDGLWEPWVSRAIGKTLLENKGGLFFDLGANVGWYTLLACKLGAERVIACEPNPRMAQLLRQNVMVNGYRDKVSLIEAACSNESGVAELIVNPTEAGGGHLAPTPINREGGYLCKGECAVMRLDDILWLSVHPERQSKPIIIKIDVEGFEPQVIAGAPELMKLRPFLFIEHHRAPSNIDLLRELLELGYELRHVQHTGHTSEPLELEKAADLEDAEMIFCEARRP